MTPKEPIPVQQPPSPASHTDTTTAALAALNAVRATPSAEEVLGPYRQAFHLTPEAEAVVRVLTTEARRAHLVGWSQAQLARRAGVAASTVSEVVDRLRRLDLV
ncbi:MAG: helix-turn-helix domain-containing protein, partial [Candidatus Dormibacteria bacterium]